MTKDNKKTPSNRNFGLLFAGIFILFSAYESYNMANTALVFGLLTAGILTGLLALAAEDLLDPFNKAWMKLGGLMSKVVSPLTLGIIFFLLITPVALVTRIFGRDELRLKRSATKSYWVDRSSPEPARESFKNQF